MEEFLIAAAIVGIGFLFWFFRRLDRKRRDEEERRRIEALRQRREALIARFGSEEVADRIIAQKIWQGMTSEQLVESWGRPTDVDTKVYKQKTSETWKYGQTGKNRYSQRVFTENGVVVGWKQQ